MKASTAVNEKAVCGEGLVFAYENDVIVETIETHTGDQVSYIELEEVQVERDSVSYIIGQDGAGVRVMFDFRYQEDSLKEIELYRGRAGGEYGIVSSVKM